MLGRLLVSFILVSFLFLVLSTEDFVYNYTYMRAGVDCFSKKKGYLQGAYFEGRDIAGAVAKCIRRGGCHGLEHVDKVRNSQPYN